MEYVIPVALGVFLGYLATGIYNSTCDRLIRWYLNRRLQASKPAQPTNTDSRGNPDMR